QPNILPCHDQPTAGACYASPGHRPGSYSLVILASLRRSFARDWHVVLNAEDDPRPIGIRLHRQDDPLVLFLAEPAGLEQWDRRPAVLAGHGPRPEIGDGRLAVDGGIEPLQILLRVLEHPPAP